MMVDAGREYSPISMFAVIPFINAVVYKKWKLLGHRKLSFVYIYICICIRRRNRLANKHKHQEAVFIDSVRLFFISEENTLNWGEKRKKEKKRKKLWFLEEEEEAENKPEKM